jgi:hypothetical protein
LVGTKLEFSILSDRDDVHDCSVGHAAESKETSNDPEFHFWFVLKISVEDNPNLSSRENVSKMKFWYNAKRVRPRETSPFSLCINYKPSRGLVVDVQGKK